jgi:NAD(P)-dependent dehydrogenase (short-subunit alcohol dehydrogenase family)
MADRDASRRVALVTGGRRGIGRAICRQLAQAGFDLVLNDLVEDQAFARTLTEVRGLGARVEPHVADIADLGAHAALVETAWTRWPTTRASRCASAAICSTSRRTASTRAWA